MLYGTELINSLKEDIESLQRSLKDRLDRVNEGLTDWDDCFLSDRCEQMGVRVAKDKIKLIEDGGCHWFVEYATLDGTLINADWCHTKYGWKLRAEMPDGSVVWTSAETNKGLAKRSIKMVRCLRPAWFTFKSSCSGLAGIYSGNYVLFPSKVNYATGEEASEDPIKIEDFE